MKPAASAVLAAASAALLMSVAPGAHGGSRFTIEPPDAEQSRAYRYAALTAEACLSILGRRDVPFKRVAPTRGVDTPVRLTGALRGVRFQPIEPLRAGDEDDRTIADCRLMLALDDLARALRRHRVVGVTYYSIYRRRGAGWVKPGMRHQGARAMDLVSVELANGATYSVRGDFQGGIGQTTCGENATKPRRDTPGARFWRSVVCDMVRQRSFNLILTPNHDWAHRDHIHLEVRSGIRWFLMH
jgi:hypothetical protein